MSPQLTIHAFSCGQGVSKAPAFRKLNEPPGADRECAGAQLIRHQLNHLIPSVPGIDIQSKVSYDMGYANEILNNLIAILIIGAWVLAVVFKVKREH